MEANAKPSVNRAFPGGRRRPTREPSPGSPTIAVVRGISQCFPARGPPCGLPEGSVGPPQPPALRCGRRSPTRPCGGGGSTAGPGSASPSSATEPKRAKGRGGAGRGGHPRGRARAPALPKSPSASPSFLHRNAFANSQRNSVAGFRAALVRGVSGPTAEHRRDVERDTHPPSDRAVPPELFSGHRGPRK